MAVYMSYLIALLQVSWLDKGDQEATVKDVMSGNLVEVFYILRNKEGQTVVRNWLKLSLTRHCNSRISYDYGWPCIFSHAAWPNVKLVSLTQGKVNPFHVKPSVLLIEGRTPTTKEMTYLQLPG